MSLEPADEVVGERRQPQAAGVIGWIAVERVLAVAPQAEVEVAAIAGQVRERLGHERREQPALLRQRLDHVAEEHRPVARGQRVVELEVLLELTVGVLVVGRVVVPPEPGHRLRDHRDEVEVAGQRAHVVTRLVERVERVGEGDPTVLSATQQEVLELRPHLQLEPERLGPLERVAQDRSRTERPWLSLDRHVAGEAGDGGLPWQHREAGGIGHRDHVGVVGSLSEIAGREPGEPGAVGQQVVEVMGGYQLRAGLAVHVDELGK